MDGIRPALLSAASAGALHRLLGFRHFLRPAYAVDLDLALLLDHAQRMERAHPGLVADIRTFVEHLASMEEAIG